MEVIPSIDLYRRWVVKLTGGKRSTAWWITDEVLPVAEHWKSRGARRIHVVDLDAAFGKGSNTRLIGSLIRKVPSVGVQVSGGVRSLARIRGWMDRGARRVIVGTRAVKDPEWLARAAREFRSRLFVAVDGRGERIVVHGWTKSAGLKLQDYLSEVDGLPFGGYLYTDVRVEGRHRGFRRDAVKKMLSLTDKPVLYSGGVRSTADVRALRRMGLSGVILGASIYRGTLTLRQAMRAAR